MDAIGIIASAGNDAGAAGGVPAWVEALRAPSGDLPIVAYNFAFGGSGQGWGGDDGINPTTLTVEECLEAGAYIWNPATIIDGLGLTAASDAHPSFVEELVPLSIWTNGATLYLQTVPNTPTASRLGFAYYMWENPNFGFWGAVNHLWSTDMTNNPVEYQGNDFNSTTDTPSPTATTVMKSVLSVYPSSDCKGSSNGGAVVTVPNIPASTTPNYITLEGGGTANICYAQIMAVYALQPSGDLPTMSAV